MANMPNFTYPAPHGKRIIAFFIDTTISLIIANLLGAVLNFISPSLAFLCVILVPNIYFIFFPMKTKSTPGKKLLGLELVHAETGEPLGFKALFGRETFGRLLSGLIFMGGYLMIFFTENRRSLHDKMYGSLVVSTNSPDEENFAKALAVGLGSFATIAGVLVYGLFFSSFPLKQFASSLEAHGVQIEGVNGNLAHGFSFKSFKFENNLVSFDLQDIAFEYSSLIQFFQKDGIVIDKILASRVDIDLKMVDGLPPFSKYQKSQNPNNALNVNEVKDLKNEIKGLNLVIHTFDVNKLSIKKEGNELVEFERFFLSQLNIHNDTIGIEKIWLESKKIFANIESFALTGKIFNLKNADLVLRKNLFPDIFSADVDIHLSGLGDLQNNSFQGSVEGFRKSVSLLVKDKDLTIRAKGLQPHWYFKGSLPMHSVNFDFSGKIRDLLSSPTVKGNFILRNRLFTLVSPQVPGKLLEAKATEGTKVWTAFISRNQNRTGFPFLLNLKSSILNDDKLALLDFYFGKTDGLSESEAQMFTAEKKYYEVQGEFQPGQRLPASREGIQENILGISTPAVTK